MMACVGREGRRWEWTVDGGKGFVPSEMKSQRCDRQVVESLEDEKPRRAAVAERNRIVVHDRRD